MNADIKKKVDQKLYEMPSGVIADESFNSREQAEAWEQWDMEISRLLEDEEAEADAHRRRKVNEDEAEIQREM